MSEDTGRPPGGCDGAHHLQCVSGASDLHQLTEVLCARVEGELVRTRADLSACHVESAELRRRLENLEREHRRVCDAHAALEREVAELGSLCVVMERVHGALDHAEVLAAVQDVVINVIGSEEMAVFEPDGEWLRPVQSFGVEAHRLEAVAPGFGPIGRAAARRKGWIVGDGPPPPDGPDLTACVPLVAGDRLAGVLVIWRMLAHKPVFGDSDRRALEILCRHAATALHLTSSGRERPLVRAV